MLLVMDGFVTHSKPADWRPITYLFRSLRETIVGRCIFCPNGRKARRSLCEPFEGLTNLVGLCKSAMLISLCLISNYCRRSFDTSVKDTTCVHHIQCGLLTVKTLHFKDKIEFVRSVKAPPVCVRTIHHIEADNKEAKLYNPKTTRGCITNRGCTICRL